MPLVSKEEKGSKEIDNDVADFVISIKKSKDTDSTKWF